MSSWIAVLPQLRRRRTSICLNFLRWSKLRGVATQLSLSVEMWTRAIVTRTKRFVCPKSSATTGEHVVLTNTDTRQVQILIFESPFSAVSAVFHLSDSSLAVSAVCPVAAEKGDCRLGKIAESVWELWTFLGSVLTDYCAAGTKGAGSSGPEASAERSKISSETPSTWHSRDQT
jgi:hypothetical protein